MSLGLAPKVASQSLALGKRVEGGLLNAVGVLAETHVPQHHHGAQEKGGGVGKALAGDIRSGTVDGLEDGALVTNVARGRQAETTNQASAHVGQNVTVQVGHDEDLVVIREGVGNHLQAGVVKQLSVELDAREVLGDLLAHAKEQTVAHLHDSGLVDDADLLAADLLGMLESETQDTLAGLASDELDALNNTIDDNVLNSRVLSLGVFTDQDRVDVVVRGLEARDGAAWPEVGKKVEGTAESQVQGNVALADRGLERRRASTLAGILGRNRKSEA